jgi:hypothetical protein
MSTSDLSSKFMLRIRVADEYKYLVNILLFDSNNRIISPIEKSRYQNYFQLKKGLYTVRIEMNAEIIDKVIALNSNKEYLVSSDLSQSSSTNIIEPPQQFSSALLSGDNSKVYGSSHEYYTYPAIDFSKRDTFFFPGHYQNDSDSSLFIFMRFPSLDKYHNFRSKWSISFYHNFEIVNEDGELLFKFESRNGIEVNENDGWLAFNTKLPNGIYYLIYRGVEPRQIPIYVFKNWHTQFFMTLGNEPLFGTTRIFISKLREFNPKANTNKYIDILLDKLQNGDYSLDEELLEIAAYGKYESPMLGLICSYIYFKSSETRSDRLFNIIFKNMQNVILKDNDESPDIRALNILAAEHFKKLNYKKTAVKGTPMLRIGFEAIQNASLKNKRLISKKSINDFISETLFYDSPFNTFKPIPFYKKPKVISNISDNMNIEDAEKSKAIELLGIEKEIENSKISKSVDLKDDKFSMSIQNYLKPNTISFIKSSDTNLDSENNWVKTSISDLLNSNGNISINDISKQLNLSGNTVTRIFDDWETEVKNKK